METVEKMSKIDIVKGLVVEKMTAALQEIVAVVEATVAGYEAEVTDLKQELSRSKAQLEAVLQPQLKLHRIVIGVGTRDSSASTDAQTDEWRHEHKDITDCGESEECTGKNEDDVAATALIHEETQLENEDSDCGLADVPSDFPTDGRRADLKADTINDAQKVKRKRRLPGRYSSNHKETDTDGDNKRKPSQNKKQRSSNINKIPITLRVGLLKNGPDTDLSNEALALEDSVQVLLCQQNLSESDFFKLLRSTFPKLGENRPFEAYLDDSNHGSDSHRPNRMTATELYTAFQSHQQKQLDFYIKLKEFEDPCDTVTNPPELNDDKSASNGLEEEPSETGGTSNVANENDAVTSIDSAAQSDDHDDNDDDGDDDWDHEDEGHSDAPKPEKKKRKKSQTRKVTCVSCKVCGQLFNSESILTKHTLTHFDDPKCVCGVCGEHLVSSEELKSHLETHQKLHQCETCGRYFLSLQSHKRHTAEEACRKDLATDKLPKEDELNRDKPYKCDMCPLTFKYQGQLEVHYRTHTGERPYCCETCGKCLVDFRSLSRHRLTHTGQRNFCCKTCGTMCATEQNLKSHEKIHSAREKSFLCDICSKSFYTNATLLNHQKRHDESFRVKCPVCDKSLRGDLISHMKTHKGERPFSCTECGKTFKRGKNLRLHMNSHRGIKPFSCTVCAYTCGRKHHLAYHMRIHTGHKPHKCSLCDKAFTQSHCLKAHMKSHQTEEQTAAGQDEEGAS